MSTLKSLVKKLIHLLGLDLRPFNLGNVPEAQTVKALEVVGINLVFDIGANEGQWPGKCV